MGEIKLARRYRGNNVAILTFTCMLSGFLFSYNTGVFSASMIAVGAALGWGNKPTNLQVLCTALMPAGGFIGAMSSSFLSDRYGRIKAILIGDLVGILGASITMIPYTASFGIGRFLSGCMIGICSSVSNTYMSEVAPKEIRGRVGSIFQLLRMTGLACAYSMGLALPSHTSDRMNGWWRAMFILPAFFNVIQATLFLTVNKVESPYWLFKQGRFEEAKQSLNVIYIEDAEKEFNNLQSSKADELDERLRGKNYFATIKNYLFNKEINKMVRSALILGVFQPISGYGAISVYSTIIFTAITGDKKKAKEFNVIYACIGICGVLTMIPLIDRLGRKAMFIIGTTGMMICHLFVASFEVGDLGSPQASAFFIFFYLYNFNLSIGPVLLTYVGEIGTSTLMGLSVGCLWLGYLAVGVVVPYIIAGIGLGGLFYILAGICFAGLLYIIFEVYETKGMSKEEIRKLFIKTTHHRVDLSEEIELGGNTSPKQAEV